MTGPIPNLLARVFKSAVFWSWAYTALRLSSGLILFPLLVRILSKTDFGMYSILFMLSGAVPIIDFGFSANIGRSISYAMGGARKLEAHGIAHDLREAHSSSPNFELLWQLTHATRRIYCYIALAALILFGTVGTIVIGLRVEETSSPGITWLAWALTLTAIIWELYSGWWNIFLRGMNQVRRATQIGVFASALNIALTSVLLLGGAGILSVPIASLVASCTLRLLARHYCLQVLNRDGGNPTSSDLKPILAAIWPNSWRLGVQLLTGYLSANLIIFLPGFDLAANAQYGLSMRIMMMIQGVAIVWISVKWPLIGQYRARHDTTALRRMLWPRIWLQTITFIVLTAMAIGVGQPLLVWLKSDKELLPPLWMAILALNLFLETRFSFWGTLIFTENRMPFVWPAIASNLLSVLLIMVFLKFTSLKFGALIAGPLIAGSLFNYWYWPLEAARSLQTTWFRFVFQRAGIEKKA